MKKMVYENLFGDKYVKCKNCQRNLREYSKLIKNGDDHFVFIDDLLIEIVNEDFYFHCPGYDFNCKNVIAIIRNHNYNDRLRFYAKIERNNVIFPIEI